MGRDNKHPSQPRLFTRISEVRTEKQDAYSHWEETYGLGGSLEGHLMAAGYRHLSTRLRTTEALDADGSWRQTLAATGSFGLSALMDQASNKLQDQTLHSLRLETHTEKNWKLPDQGGSGEYLDAVSMGAGYGTME